MDAETLQLTAQLTFPDFSKKKCNPLAYSQREAYIITRSPDQSGCKASLG